MIELANLKLKSYRTCLNRYFGFGFGLISRCDGLWLASAYNICIYVVESLLDSYSLNFIYVVFHPSHDRKRIA